MKNIPLFLLLIIFVFALLIKLGKVSVAKAFTQDNSTGTYTDNLNDTLGIGTTSSTVVSNGTQKLSQGTTSFYASFDSSLNASTSLGDGTANNAGGTFPSLLSGYQNNGIYANTEKTLRYFTSNNFAPYKSSMELYLKTNSYYYKSVDKSDRLAGPAGVYYDEISNKLYILDYTGNNIIKYSEDTETWQKIGYFGRSGIGTLYAAYGIFYNQDDDFIYVCDLNNHRIIKTKIDGSGWETYGTKSNNPSVFLMVLPVFPLILLQR